MIRVSKLLRIAALSLATTGTALAQDASPPPEAPPATPPEGEPPPGGEPPADDTSPSLTLAQGKLVIAGSTLNINFSADSVGEPISFAPSVWYGVQDRLTVGLTHDFGTTPWTPRPGLRSFTVGLDMDRRVDAGAGICVTGKDSSCPRVYASIGVDALYALRAGKLSLAAHPALDIGSFEPFFLDLRVGALGLYLVNDRIAVAFEPRLQLGLAGRADGNQDSIDLPVWLWYAINDKLSAYFHTGIHGPFDGFGDSYAFPIQIGANLKVNEELTAGLDFSFLRINDSADGRALGLRVIYAL